MRQTELLRRIGSYATMLVVTMLALLSTGCGSDEEDVNEIKGPDNGWYTYTTPKVFTGEISNMREEDTHEGLYFVYLIMDNTSEFIYPYALFCDHVAPKGSKTGDRIRFKMFKFSDSDPHFGEFRSAVIEIIEVIDEEEKQ